LPHYDLAASHDLPLVNIVLADLEINPSPPADAQSISRQTLPATTYQKFASSTALARKI